MLKIEYKKKEYNWVNERVVKGILYQCYRCSDNPHKTLILKDKKVHKEPANLKAEWKEIK